MTWPFENDTSAIAKKLAKKSLQSEKRRKMAACLLSEMPLPVSVTLTSTSVSYTPLFQKAMS